MDYGTIITAVVSATGRPDKEAYIQTIVNPLVRFLAGLQDSYRDLSEATETVAAVDANNLIYNMVLPASFRKVGYLRPMPFTKLLDPVTPDKSILSGKEMTNCYYISADTIIIRLRLGFETTSMARGYYLYPTTLVAMTDANWITDLYGDLLIDMCAAKVFRMTGDPKSAALLEQGALGIIMRVDQLRTQSKTGGTANLLGSNPQIRNNPY